MQAVLTFNPRSSCNGLKLVGYRQKDDAPIVRLRTPDSNERADRVSLMQTPRGPREVNLAVPLILASAMFVGMCVGFSFHNAFLGVFVGVADAALLCALEWVLRRRRRNKQGV